MRSQSLRLIPPALLWHPIICKYPWQSIAGPTRLNHLCAETTKMRPERHVTQERNEDFVARLFREQGEHLTRHLTRLLGNAALAQDVVQDTYERLCTLQIEHIEKPRAYLFQMGVRFALMRMRRAKFEARDVLRRIPLEDSPDRIAGPEDLAMLDQSVSRLREQIAALDPQLRQVLVLRHLQGMEASEIINQLGISAFTYERRLTAAKRQLRQRLRAIGVDPQAF